MSKEILLYTPGPTRIPPEVQVEMSRPMIHHRSDEFEKIFASLRNNLHLLSQTDGESVVLTGSGTAAMEATIVSLFSPSDHVVIVDGGKFGQRWATLAQRYRLSFTVIQKPWGRAATIEDVMPHIFPHTRGVLMQACESSTGVYNPIEKIGQAIHAAHPHILFVVDAITAFGIYPLSMITHHIDGLIFASQKALMSAPGLSGVILSKKAISHLRVTQSLYLSLIHELESQKKNRPAFTPAVSLIRGLEKSTDMIVNEGMKCVHERHLRMRNIARGFFHALGFQCFASEEESSLGITSVRTIPGVNIEHWLDSLRNEHGILLASGQGELKGAIFRMAHMGYCSENDVISACKIMLQSLQKILPTNKAQEFLNQS